MYLVNHISHLPFICLICGYSYIYKLTEHLSEKTLDDDDVDIDYVLDSNPSSKSDPTIKQIGQNNTRYYCTRLIE